VGTGDKGTGDIGTGDKVGIRREVRARRRARPDGDRRVAADQLAQRVLALPEVTKVRTVAAYVSTPAEPGTLPLRTLLRERGMRVLLPVLLGDDDLDWAVDDGRLEPGRRPAVAEPAGARLGPDAIAQATVVVCPAAAVALDGTRLGQGGGSYDRALARTTALVVALVHDDELVDALPRDPHDRPVHVAVTPGRTVRLPVSPRPTPPGPAGAPPRRPPPPPAR
jgi:5-formyltetrahydrofolate cyclo-ligase